MNHIKSLISFLFCFITLLSFAQTGAISGRVYNSINNEPIPFANIVIENTNTGSTSNIDGVFSFTELSPGIYNLKCSFVGFKQAEQTEIRVISGKKTTINFAMTERSTSLKEVEIVSSPFKTMEESPVSLRTINATEIYRNPGGNRDISKVIQVLPGVAATQSFRNDLIVRGGAPNENRFYIDGIEIPNINHFATQGSSGGPVGLINVNFIREVDFFAGAFPANRGNALSSVLEFKQIEGNSEKVRGNFMLGSSDIGLTLDGPLGKKSNYIFSLRRSYLQFLFQALGLPFLPTYNDFQYKHTIKLNKKNQINIIGIGAIDDFVLNQSVNDGLTDQDQIIRNNYILNTIPVNTQWNYTAGASWKHFSTNSFQTIVFSRNHLNNKAVKYRNNLETTDNLLLDYSSQEIENKFRFEHTFRKNGWKLNTGIGLETAICTNSTFNKIEIGGNVQTIDFESELDFVKYAAFAQLSRTVLKERLQLSLGIRTDANSYASTMNNPIDQLSPRFSASYILSDKWRVNGNIGRYFQLPAYTVLGYRNTENKLVNQNNVSYIASNHAVTGLEFLPSKFSRITVEGFYKTYSNYPFSLNDSISLANLGADFGVIGNEPVNSSSEGRSYGAELFMQQKLSSSIYGLVSYTFVRSEFKNSDENYIPSAWDNRHVLNITAGKKFKKNWEVGFKFRLLGGAPYTPYNRSLSANKQVWDVSQSGVFDFSQLNSERYEVSHGMDVRIDKTWSLKKWSINAYIDIQNIYNFQAKAQPFLDAVRDDNNNIVSDPNNPNAYLLREIENTNGTLLPSVGLMVEF